MVGNQVMGGCHDGVMGLTERAQKGLCGLEDWANHHCVFQWDLPERG